MALVTVAAYRSLTQDRVSADADIDEQLGIAQALVEEYLGRPLEDDERIERLRIDGDGRVWPSATPITDAGELTVEGAALVGADPDTPGGVFLDPSPLDRWATVTYSGGWTDETLPMTLQREIARAAYAQLHIQPVSTAIPAGAVSARSGDAAVTFAEPVSAAAAIPELSDKAKRTLRPWRKAHAS